MDRVKFCGFRALYSTNIEDFVSSRDLTGSLDLKMAYRLSARESLSGTVTYEEFPENTDRFISGVVWKIPNRDSDCFQGRCFGVDDDTNK